MIEVDYNRYFGSVTLNLNPVYAVTGSVTAPCSSCSAAANFSCRLAMREATRVVAEAPLPGEDTPVDASPPAWSARPALVTRLTSAARPARLIVLPQYKQKLSPHSVSRAKKL